MQLRYDDLSKKCHVIFKKFLLLLWNFLGYLVYVPSFKSINGSSLSRTKYDGDSFTPTPSKQLRPNPCKWVCGQNTSVGIGLIELTEPSDTLNYKPFFKHCILETILHIFSLLTFVWNKIFVLKTELYFTFSLFDLDWHSVLQY